MKELGIPPKGENNNSLKIVFEQQTFCQMAIRIYWQCCYVSVQLNLYDYNCWHCSELYETFPLNLRCVLRVGMCDNNVSGDRLQIAK